MPQISTEPQHFHRKAHAGLHDSVLRRARDENIPVRDCPTILSVEEAYLLVQKGIGIAFLARSGTFGRDSDGLAILPLADHGFAIDTCLVCRAETQSQLVSEFVRAYMKQLTGRRFIETPLPNSVRTRLSR